MKSGASSYTGRPQGRNKKETQKAIISDTLNTELKKWKGFTFMLSVGEYAGFHILCRKTVWRVCLGWLAFSVVFLDFEAVACDAIAGTESKQFFN